MNPDYWKREEYPCPGCPDGKMAMVSATCAACWEKIPHDVKTSLVMPGNKSENDWDFFLEQLEQGVPLAELKIAPSSGRRR